MSQDEQGITYSLVWCSSSYRASLYGFIVHAAADDVQPGGWTNPRTLCGVRWNDCGWGEVGKDGEPGCIRCRNALRKLGVIKSPAP